MLLTKIVMDELPDPDSYLGRLRGAIICTVRILLTYSKDPSPSWCSASLTLQEYKSQESTKQCKEAQVKGSQFGDVPCFDCKKTCDICHSLPLASGFLEG